MFEYCKHYPCIYDRAGFCGYLHGPCKREVVDGRCIHSGLYLKCPYAFTRDGVQRCGFDSGNTQKYVPGLPAHKYEKKLAIDDLPDCLLEIMFRGKERRHFNV